MEEDRDRLVRISREITTLEMTHDLMWLWCAKHCYGNTACRFSTSLLQPGPLAVRLSHLRSIQGNSEGMSIRRRVCNPVLYFQFRDLDWAIY
ncbi:hypothetical protein TNCV_2942131 [Trichonephila clavipes]|nr:hypothetical protein TNCV_2942131 [Trichonephila clavipes]